MTEEFSLLGEPRFPTTFVSFSVRWPATARWQNLRDGLVYACSASEFGVARTPTFPEPYAITRACHRSRGPVNARRSAPRLRATSTASAQPRRSTHRQRTHRRRGQRAGIRTHLLSRRR